MVKNNQIMESMREVCGFGEDYEYVRLWETGMDELQQEYWEIYMGGPEDSDFEAQNALHEFHWETMGQEDAWGRRESM